MTPAIDMLEVDHEYHQRQENLDQRQRHEKTDQRAVTKDEIKEIAKCRNDGLRHIRQNIEDIQNSVQHLNAEIS